MSLRTLSVACLVACGSIAASTPAAAQAFADASALAGGLALARLQAVQQRECSQRVGPFVTQSTAWQRWRDARSRGYAVSNGVVPCYDQSGRGYCFFAYYDC